MADYCFPQGVRATPIDARASQSSLNKVTGTVSSARRASARKPNCLRLTSVVGLSHPRVVRSRLTSRLRPTERQRRSTIEVHPDFCGGPSSLEELHTSPENRLQQIQVASRLIILWPKYTITSVFETRLIFRRFLVMDPRHPENILAENCYLYYSRTRHHVIFVSPVFLDSGIHTRGWLELRLSRK